MRTILNPRGATRRTIPNFRLSEKAGRYEARRALTDEQIIRAAKALIVQRLASQQFQFTSPDAGRDFLVPHCAEHEREVFIGLFLDNQHRLISAEELFLGTIDGASIHPREVVKRALQLNACALIVAHNHPSGTAKPSQADILITNRIREALALVEVRLLDHFIVGGSEVRSLVEMGKT